MKESYFDGTVFEYIAYILGCAFVTVISLGILFPFAICTFKRWETSHTVINGRRLYFDGTALQLFGNWIIWFLLTLITFGIYGFWIGVRVRQWVTKHTFFEMPEIDQTTPQERPFPLKSKDLIHSDAMTTYCVWYHFENSASEELCQRLFEKAEPMVSPDKEVVMTFIALRDYKSPAENGGPCACAISNTRLIIVWDGGSREIPVEQITDASLQPGRTMSALIVSFQGETLSLGVDNACASTLLDCFRRSVIACVAELYPDRQAEYAERMRKTEAETAARIGLEEPPRGIMRNQKIIAAAASGVLAVVILAVVLIRFSDRSGQSKENDVQLPPPAVSAMNTDPAASSEASSAETAEPEVPQEYLNALSQAQSYSDNLHMSRMAIYDQLISEYGGQFPPEAAQYAIDNVEADWEANALEKARSYYETMNMSKEDIRDQLTSAYGERFTADEADYAIEHLD